MITLTRPPERVRWILGDNDREAVTGGSGRPRGGLRPPKPPRRCATGQRHLVGPQCSWFSAYQRRKCEWPEKSFTAPRIFTTPGGIGLNQLLTAAVVPTTNDLPSIQLKLLTKSSVEKEGSLDTKCFT